MRLYLPHMTQDTVTWRRAFCTIRTSSHTDNVLFLGWYTGITQVCLEQSGEALHRFQTLSSIPSHNLMLPFLQTFLMFLNSPWTWTELMLSDRRMDASKTFPASGRLFRGCYFLKGPLEASFWSHSRCRLETEAALLGHISLSALPAQPATPHLSLSSESGKLLQTSGKGEAPGWQP